MKASELIQKLQLFVDEGKDYEVWKMFGDAEYELDGDPNITWEDEEKIYL